MPNEEGESLNFDELKSPGEQAAEEPVLEGQSAPAAETDDQLQPLEEIEAGAAETPPPEEEKVKAEESEEGPEEIVEAPPSKMPFYLEVAAAIGVPVVLAALFLLEIIYVSTAIYLFGVCVIPFALWKGRKSNTVYTVFLGCTLLALMTASYFLWIELRQYDFDFKARKARVSMVMPIEHTMIARCDAVPENRV